MAPGVRCYSKNGIAYPYGRFHQARIDATPLAIPVRSSLTERQEAIRQAVEEEAKEKAE